MTKFVVTSDKYLITSHVQTRAGFIEAAIAKNVKAKPYIEQAKTLKSYAQTIDNPKLLKNIPHIKNLLLTASGLSDKALNYFDDSDKLEAIDKLIENFLEPAGEYFVDELVYRYLIIRGDSLGGEMRNYVGMIAQIKIIRKILSILDASDIAYQILRKKNKAQNKWDNQNYENDYNTAEEITAIAWNGRLLLFNAKIPLVNNNVDICLFNGIPSDYSDIVNHPDKTIMLGELKGGIDPAGADEHWKTGNAALGRIRTAYKAANIPVLTSFIAAAIEVKMAKEIWEQLTGGILSNAANITEDQQLTMYCDWLINL